MSLYIHVYYIFSYYQPTWESDEINKWISFTEEWKEAHMYNITHKEIFMDQRVRILILSQMCPELTDLPSLMSVLVYFILSACSTYPCFLTYQTAASPSNWKLRFAWSVKFYFFSDS